MTFTTTRQPGADIASFAPDHRHGNPADGRSTRLIRPIADGVVRRPSGPGESVIGAPGATAGTRD